MLRELTVEELAWSCPEDWVPWTASSEVDPAEGIVGQARAVKAIAFGLAMRGIGFNIFVTGLSGTGRLTTIKQFLDRLGDKDGTPDDVCFVYNFQMPEEPRPLLLRAGAGKVLRDGMKDVVRELAESLPGMLSAKEFREQAEREVADLKEQEQQMVTAFEAEVREAGFVLVQIQSGPMSRPEVLPLVDGKPAGMDELATLVHEGKLTDEQATGFEKRHDELVTGLHDMFQKVTEIRHKVQKRVVEVRARVVRPVFEERLRLLGNEIDDERADVYFKALQQDFEDNLDLFMASEEGEGDRFLRWRVNLIVDNSQRRGQPVEIETEPTYSNLFGTIERTLASSGEVITSHMRLQAGSLLRANGGYLVLNAEDLLQEPRSWPGLKRALKYRRVRIQSVESLVLGAAALRPEEVPLQVKVVVIGTRSIYDILYRYDTDFSKIFKVLADFDSVIQTSEQHVRDVVSVLSKVAEEEDLPPLDRGGMAAMMEEAVRLGRWRRRFSSRFSDLADVLREAAYYAVADGRKLVTGEDVRTARAEALARHSLSEDRTHEFLTEGMVRVETDGTATGQVNGLAVYDLGHHRFGKPSRITAQVGLGREGVVNVERQAGLSGPTHDKGVQILTGFLRGTFARKVPLNMGCSITFEQSYGGIDGDSASSTEVYAILSALSGEPLRQEVAVTGSVDQFGRVQTIGGVNEKIEGFFRLCSSRGLTGSQGVMIPAANVGDLHLASEVREAVAAGRFHVWSVETVEEGIELLSGVAAGKWCDEQGWSEDSIYGRCQQRLEEMARLLREAGKAAKDDNGNGNNEEAGDGGCPDGGCPDEGGRDDDGEGSRPVADPAQC